jgi:hypothetical protein
LYVVHEASYFVTLTGSRGGRLLYFAGTVKLLLSPGKAGGVPKGNQATRIGQVAMMENEFPALLVGILIEVVDTVGIKQGTPPLDAMHFITLV